MQGVRSNYDYIVVVAGLFSYHLQSFLSRGMLKFKWLGFCLCVTFMLCRSSCHKDRNSFIESNSLFFHALAYFWRNIETCALKVFKCERLFVNSTALNLSHVAILMMTISFLKCAFFRTLNFLMYITCSLKSILNAKMHGLCCENNLRRNFTGLVTAPITWPDCERQSRSLGCWCDVPRSRSVKHLSYDL